jgi:toluene monooxygenase system protein D
MNRVGPVLSANEIGRAVSAALVQHNSDVEVQDRGAYLRVLAPRRCALTREAVERTLGRPFRLPIDLELVMASFSGAFSVTEEQAVWTFEVPDD